jgi:hypothetical protein
VHFRLERRPAVPGQLAAVEIKLDQFGVGDQPERPPRRDEYPLRVGNADADMAETFHDPEIGQHAAGVAHRGAHRGGGSKHH